MFLLDENVETNVLRQGDILADVLLVGAINPAGIRTTAALGSEDDPVSWTVEKKPEFGHAMVVSHSCEIDPENEVKLTSVLLAPIRDVNSATAPDKVQDLIDSNIIEGDEEQSSFLKYFYLPANAALPFDRGSIADFSKIFSLRNNYYEELVARKKLQMDPDFTSKMALKLGLYFYRE